MDNKTIIGKYKNFLSKNELPVGEFDCHKSDLNLEEINFLLAYVDDFINVFEWPIEKDEVISKLYELSTTFGVVGKTNVFERDFKAEDFPLTAQYAEYCFKNLKPILTNLKNYKTPHRRQIIINSLVLCATHSQDFPWSNKHTTTFSFNFLNKLLESSGLEDLGVLLCGEGFHPTIIKGVFKKIRPFLLKNSWQNYPSSCYVFAWFLQQIKHPYLVDYLSDIFPPPCMFISNHLTSHQVLAIKCFHHILDNVPPTIITVDGKEEVVWSLLKPHIFSTEEKIIEVLSPCLLKLPSIRHQNTKENTWSKYDEAFHQLLIRTEMESSVAIKQMYLSHIQAFLQVSPAFKHLKRLFKVIEDCFYRDVNIICKIKSLRILKDVIKSCWPRMKIYCSKILRDIIILLYEIESNTAEDIESLPEIHNLCTDCLIYLKYIAPEQFSNSVTKYIENGNDMPGVKIFESVLHKF